MNLLKISAFVATFVLGMGVAMSTPIAYAADSCSDKQAVIDTLLTFTVNLVKEIDAIKTYGPSVVPVTGQGIVMGSASTPSASAGGIINTMPETQQFDDQKTIALKHGYGPAAINAAFETANDGYEETELGPDHVRVSLMSYLKGDEVSVKVMVDDIEITGEGKEECGVLKYLTVQGCSVQKRYKVPVGKQVTVTASYNGSVKTFILSKSNLKVGSSWD